MRTTANIEDEALELIRKHASERSLSLGEAISDLVYRGVESMPKLKTKNGWAICELPPGSPKIDTEVVKKWIAEDEEEEHRRALSPRR